MTSYIAQLNELRAEKYGLEKENEQLKEELLQSDYVKASVFSDREEYKNQIVELKNEIIELKEQLMIIKNDNALLKSILND